MKKEEIPCNRIENHIIIEYFFFGMTFKNLYQIRFLIQHNTTTNAFAWIVCVEMRVSQSHYRIYSIYITYRICIVPLHRSFISTIKHRYCVCYMRSPLLCVMKLFYQISEIYLNKFNANHSLSLTYLRESLKMLL